MKGLHKSLISGKKLEPKEGQRELLCSNKDSLRCPFLGSSISGIISTEEYRDILNDMTSSEEQIANRVEYITALCRNIIRLEFEYYEEKNINSKNKQK